PFAAVVADPRVGAENARIELAPVLIERHSKMFKLGKKPLAISIEFPAVVEQLLVANDGRPTGMRRRQWYYGSQRDTVTFRALPGFRQDHPQLANVVAKLLGEGQLSRPGVEALHQSAVGVEAVEGGPKQERN